MSILVPPFRSPFDAMKCCKLWGICGILWISGGINQSNCKPELYQITVLQIAIAFLRPSRAFWAVVLYRLEMVTRKDSRRGVLLLRSPALH